MKKNLRKNRKTFDSENSIDLSNIEDSKEMKNTRTIVCIILASLSFYFLGKEVTLANSAFAISFILIQNVVVALYLKYKGEHDKFLYFKILILIISVSYMYYSVGISLAIPTIGAGLVSSAFRLKYYYVK